jgi:hypothetical protein
VSGHGLDTEIRGSCGHLWTLRHVACPQCFAELKTRLAELEEIVGHLADCGGEPGDDLDIVAHVSLGLCRRARRVLGMEVEP